MKNILLNLTLILSMNSCIAQQSSTILVSAVPLSTTSSFRISCQAFDSNFSEIKKENALPSTSIKKVLSLIKLFTKQIETPRIDVRGKINIYSGDKLIEEICFDEFGSFYRQGQILKNDKLFNYLLQGKLIDY